MKNIQRMGFILIAVVAFLSGTILTGCTNGNLNLKPSNTANISESTSLVTTIRDTPTKTANESETPSSTPSPTPTSDQFNGDDGMTYIYPSFSWTAHEKQREFVNEYFSEDFKKITEVYTNNTEVGVAITVVDINNDEIDDMLVILAHPYYTGYKYTGLLIGFVEQDIEIMLISLSQIHIGGDSIENQRIIKLRENESGWMDIVIDYEEVFGMKDWSLLSWDGEKYYLVEAITQ